MVPQGLQRIGVLDAEGPAKIRQRYVAFVPLVIPAKGGIYSADLSKCAVIGLDSRPSASSGQAFRGNDRRRVGSPFPNDTSTRGLSSW